MKTLNTRIEKSEYGMLRGFIILSSTIFFLFSIKQGHNWGGDFALYISHAKNIALGLPYRDTGYIYNPYSHWYGPVTYPPIFPLLLSFVYRFFGLDLYSMRVMIVICFAAMLWALDRYCLSRIDNKKIVLAILITVAFSPYYWETKNSVISDIPYTMFLFLSLIVSDKIDQLENGRKQKILYSIVFGLLSYLAYGTRSVGIFIIISYCINQIVRNKTLPYTLFVSLGIFIILFIAQNVFLHSDTSYIMTMSTNNGQESDGGIEIYIIEIFAMISSIFHNAYLNTIEYTKVMKWYWQTGASSFISILMTVTTVILSIIGYIKIFRNNKSTGEINFLIYIIILIISPFFQGFRYLIPIFPMYALYMFKIFDYKAINSDVKAIQPIRVILTSAIILIYISAYSKIEFGPFTYGVGEKETQDMFSFIKNHTPKQSMVIFQKPRLMALFGERKSTTYFYETGGDFESLKFLDHLNEIKATHLVVSNGVWGNAEMVNYVNWVKKPNKSKRMVYHNSDFEIYEIIVPSN